VVGRYIPAGRLETHERVQNEGSKDGQFR